jgi:hypothetical protein
MIRWGLNLSVTVRPQRTLPPAKLSGGIPGHLASRKLVLPCCVSLHPFLGVSESQWPDETTWLLSFSVPVCTNFSTRLHATRWPRLGP